VNIITKNNNLVLSLKNIGVYYWRRRRVFSKERFWAIKDISLDLNHGETLGIIGRNGVGKSTLLKLMAGIIDPDRGRMVRNGERASLLALQAGFSPHLSGRENAILNGMLLGMRRRDVESKMDEIISFSELYDFIDDPIKSYSSGMKARLGFAIAFQADPELLLIDEVIGVGDEAFRIKSTNAMKKRILSGRTVVLVSHNPFIINELCDRVVWIKNGTVHLEGNVENVLKAYKEDIEKPNKVSAINI
jgi:lipopolysaccharide transport system ATP-binding protein